MGSPHAYCTWGCSVPVETQNQAELDYLLEIAETDSVPLIR